MKPFFFVKLVFYTERKKIVCLSNLSKFKMFLFQWNLICDKAYVGANVQAVFSAGMLVGSLVFGVTSDFFGRRFCIYICAALLV